MGGCRARIFHILFFSSAKRHLLFFPQQQGTCFFSSATRHLILLLWQVGLIANVKLPFFFFRSAPPPFFFLDYARPPPTMINGSSLNGLCNLSWSRCLSKSFWVILLEVSNPITLYEASNLINISVTHNYLLQSWWVKCSVRLYSEKLTGSLVVRCVRNLEMKQIPDAPLRFIQTVREVTNPASCWQPWQLNIDWVTSDTHQATSDKYQSLVN